MIEAPHYSAKGSRHKSGFALPGDLFDGTVHEAALHQAVKSYLGNQRQGTAKTKTRGFISGGNKKPWRQKGTGRARQGSIRSPLWRGGGTVFGPVPRDYRTAIPRKIRALARRSAFNARAREGNLIVMDPVPLETPRTRELAGLLEKMGLTDRKVLVLTNGTNRNLYLSGRNLPRTQVMGFAEASAYDVLWAETVLVEEQMPIDRELSHPDPEVRKEAADMVALLTPIIKAFMTDNGWIATSEAMQAHGGHGYITGTGIEQYVRDARINMIYEGTNTVQSLDLLGRKILMDNGAKLRKFGAMVQAFIEENGTDEAMNEFVTPLADIGDKVGKLTMEIGMKAFQNQDEVGAAAVPYLRVVGHLVYSYFFARMAKIALAKLDSGDPFYKAKLATARFYFARLLPETAMLIRQARAGAKSLLELEAELF